MKLSIKRPRLERPTRTQLAWAAPSATLAVLIVIWAALGLVDAPAAATVAAVLALAALSALSSQRGRSDALAHGLRAWWRSAMRLALLAVCALLSMWALEAPWNPSFLGIGLPYVLIEYALVALPLLALYLVGGRRSGATVPLTLACLVLGLAEYFVHLFKDQSILPGDIYALSTAAAVSGRYEYVIDGQVLLAAVIAGAAIAVASLVPRPGIVGNAGSRRIPGPARTATNLTMGLAAALAVAVLATQPSYADDFGVELSNYWWAYDYSCRQGFLTTFIYEVQDMPIEAPDGYSASSARALEASYAEAYEASRDSGDEAASAQFDETLPSVVVIMNESFSDLSTYELLDIDYEGPAYIKGGLADALAVGELAVSVEGGGTCNTEFEMLTGHSLTFVGEGKYPYTLYDLSGTSSLARQLRSLGYETTAIHPNLATNWSRDRVYPELGFDEFLDIDDFEGAQEYHGATSDWATYERILEILGDSDAPQFVFDVTMQNHSGYNQGGIPEEDLTSYDPQDFDDPENEAYLNEYLSCINKSDSDLKEFISQLSELDRPVVVIFFGDHQPAFTEAYNDVYFEGEDGNTHAARQQQTVYFTWANYDVAGSSQNDVQRDSSSCYLAAQALYDIGAPLTNYQEASLVVSESMPFIDLFGYMAADGLWHTGDQETESSSVYEDYRWLEYRNFIKNIV